MTPEGRLKNRVTTLAKRLGLTIVRLAFRVGCASGWPDVLLLITGGKPLWMELKAPGKHPTPLQLERIKELERLGYDVCVADNVDTARAAIMAALERASVSAARFGPLMPPRGRRAVSRPGPG